MSNIVKIPSFQTTDGTLHATQRKAEDHQDFLDLKHLLVTATGNTVDIHSRDKVTNFILGYTEQIESITRKRRARHARYAKRSSSTPMS